ncbi:hypothetical protein VTI28DRAFT_6088 [Corynascus sepedonium]
MSVLGAGNNPTFGRDTGPPPPFAGITGLPPPPDLGLPPPGTVNTIPAPYYHMAMSGMAIPGMPMQYPPGGMPYAPNQLPHPMIYYGHQCYPHPPPPYTPSAGALPPLGMYGNTPHPQFGAAIAMDAQGMMYQYLSGLAGSGRFPQPAPPIDPDFPAANFINSTGGVGVEPLTNYFFPTEHAKIIVLKCAVPPWTLVPGTYADIPFHAAVVPSNVTMAELLVGFGADNPDKAKNQFWEVYPQGGGKWGWKEHCTGDDEIMMARTVRDMGWLEKREGRIQTVYLWISKA